MITVNQFYKDLIISIKSVLQNHILNWQIKQSYQQSMGNLKPPFIMLHRLTIINYGFQFGKDSNDVIQTYQISAVYSRTQNDTVEIITGAEVVILLAHWFMSDTGLKALREKGYDILRITEVFEEYYKDVSEIYQITPNFKLHLIVFQINNCE